MANLPVRSRDEILAAADLLEDVIDVPEWGTALKLRGLMMAEWNHITNLATRKDGRIDNLRLNIFTFIRGVVEPKFMDEDCDALAKKSAVVLRVATRIAELSGVTANALGAAVKNSESAPTED